MTLSTRLCFLLVLPVFGCLASKPDLYFFSPSPPCRTVAMTAKALGTDVNIKEVSIFKQEQLKPEFLKLNHRHTIPTLDDNGFVITESRAIITYLAASSPNGEKLYPKDLKKRARVDEMLYFDLGRLYQDLLDFFRPIMFEAQAINQVRAKKVDEAFKEFDQYLQRSEWAAGEEMTLADISLASTVSTAEACNVDVNKYPHVAKWYAKCKTSIPGYAEVNAPGAEIFHNAFKAATSK